MKKVLFLVGYSFISIVGFIQYTMDDELHHVLDQQELEPLTKVAQPPAKVELGRMLFFDKILSGNKDVSCATCHHPGLRSGDSLSLSIGVGGKGLGKWREMGEGRKRVPRNAPEIFNRGATAWHSMFWDSRVSGSAEKGFITPADEKLPDGLDNVLAVQAMFPVTSRDEMRGKMGDFDVHGEQNELALISNAAPNSVWLRLMQRLLDIPEYVRLFQAAYPDVAIEDLGFQHAANAIAAFEIESFTFLDSPWDKYLAGENEALGKAAKRGALLFYQDANCANCHSGNLMTDQQHHNIGIPQFGPGKEDAAPLDAGRFTISGKKEDRFSFRTPPLRNVAISGPWMHNGAYTQLEDAIRHHLNPEAALRNYDTTQLTPELRATYKYGESVISKVLETLDPQVSQPMHLSRKDMQDLMAFMEALTEESVYDLSKDIPSRVPSGLPVENVIGPSSQASRRHAY